MLSLRFPPASFQVLSDVTFLQLLLCSVREGMLSVWCRNFLLCVLPFIAPGIFQIVLFDAELSVYFLHEVKIICFLCIPSLEVIQMIYDKKEIYLSRKAKAHTAQTLSPIRLAYTGCEHFLSESRSQPNFKALKRFPVSHKHPTLHTLSSPVGSRSSRRRVGGRKLKRNSVVR